LSLIIVNASSIFSKQAKACFALSNVGLRQVTFCHQKVTKNRWGASNAK